MEVCDGSYSECDGNYQRVLSSGPGRTSEASRCSLSTALVGTVEDLGPDQEVE